MMSREVDPMHYVVRDTTLQLLSVHDLKIMRANMIESGKHTKYEFAHVQYWIMKKEDRLPANLGGLI